MRRRDDPDDLHALAPVRDGGKLESEARSLISSMVLWKTRGFEENHEFSGMVLDIEELESEVKSLVSS